MSNKELEAKLMKARADFYGWQYSAGMDLGRRFRCHHIASRPLMTEEMCIARVKKPETFKDDCSGCPRWKHYSKLAKKSRKIAY